MSDTDLARAWEEGRRSGSLAVNPYAPKRLPWEEYPDAWWERVLEPGPCPILHSRHLVRPPHFAPEALRRVLVFPADSFAAIPRILIDEARDTVLDGNASEQQWRSVLGQIADAADGAS